MRDLTVWKNEQFRQMKAEMDQLFREFSDDFGRGIFDEMRGEAPLVDISENEDTVQIKMEFPQLDPADIDISASPESIIIEGRISVSGAGQGQRIESSRRFSHRLKLPCRILPEKVEAVYRNNILEVVLPKCRTALFKKIPVRQGDV